MAKAKVEIRGDAEIRAKLLALAAQAPQVVKAFLHRKGRQIEAESQQQVPVDFGTLRSSAQVQARDTVRGFEVQVGYGNSSARYALYVHENPRSGRTGGVSPKGRRYKHWAKVGKWKYLEDPFNSETANLRGELIQALERAIRRQAS